MLTRAKWIIPLLLLILIVFKGYANLTAITQVFARIQAVLHQSKQMENPQPTRQPITALLPNVERSIAVTAASQPVLIDLVDDYRTLGYPGSRKIARDRQGNLYIAYRKLHEPEGGNGNTNERQRIFVAKSIDNGQSWEILNENQPIETVGRLVQRVPSIAVDAQDVIHVVWYGIDPNTSDLNNPWMDNNRQIKYTRSTDGGQHWDAWRNLAVVPGFDGDELWQEHPTLYVGREKMLYVVWEGRDSIHKKPQIKFIQSQDGGEQWSEWRNINPSLLTSYSRPSLIADDARQLLYLFAYAGSADFAQIVWSLSTDGGETWQPWSLVAPSSKDQRHVSAAIDQQGQIHLAWRQQSETSSARDKVQIHYTLFDGKAWLRPEIPAQNPEKHQFFPSIAVDSANHPWVVWFESSANAGLPKEDPTSGRVYVSTKNANQWLPPYRLSESISALYPSLGLVYDKEQSSIDVIWLEQDSGLDEIYYRQLDARMLQR